MIANIAAALYRVKKFNDSAEPGVTVAKLGYRTWYASVTRWDVSGTKVVVCKANESSYGRVVRALGLALLVVLQRTTGLDISDAQIRKALS